MTRFLKKLEARTQKPARRQLERLLERQYRPKIEQLEERMSPSCLFPTDPCSLHSPSVPGNAGLYFPYNPG
jgi:hypothetical protein